jgi:L-rhamnose isomerase/sugar isomerase
MTSAIELQRAYAQALIVDRKALHEYRIGNDVLMAAQTLKRGFTTDVSPILAQARLLQGAAIDPVGTYRQSGYRGKCAEMRPGKQSLGGGIV